LRLLLFDSAKIMFLLNCIFFHCPILNEINFENIWLVLLFNLSSYNHIEVQSHFFLNMHITYLNDNLVNNNLVFMKANLKLNFKNV